MIQIDKLDFIPDLDYSDYAQAELTAVPGAVDYIQTNTEQIYVASVDGNPLLVMGVVRPTLLVKPVFWFLLCRYFIEGPRLANAKALKSMLKLLWAEYPALKTYVETDWAEGERFARFGGFTKTNETAIINGRKSNVWER